MVGLVVEDHEVAPGAQLAANAAHHLGGCLGESARPAAGQERFRQLAGVTVVALFESVIVSNDDFCSPQVGQGFGRQQVEALVIVVRV